MPHWSRALVVLAGALILLVVGSTKAPVASADPDTTVAYPVRASGVHYDPDDVA